LYFAEVLPLVYNALESEHAVVGLTLCLHSYLQTDSKKVQESALNAVPDLCETIDYAEVSNVLFPRVAVRIAVIDNSSGFFKCAVVI
jgi:SCY1-like protein 2